MPDRSDLRAAVEELADRSPAFDADVVLDRLATESGHRRRSTRLVAVAAIVAAIVAVAVLVPLLATRHGARPVRVPAVGPGKTTLTKGECAGISITPQVCRSVLNAAHARADSLTRSGTAAADMWPTKVRLVTIGLHTGTVRHPNVGAPCTSGRTVVVEEFGDALTITSGGVASGIVLTADAATGRLCEVGADGGDAFGLKGQKVIYPAHAVTVHGTFIRSGGPTGNPNDPAGTPKIRLAGRIEVYRVGRTVVASGRAGKSGRFSIELPPGRYVFGGISPLISGLPCESGMPVTVGAGRNTVEVVCSVP